MWENNSVQFPRLLAEISATQDNLDIPALAESMDLTVEEVNELFDRADAAWERIKKMSACDHTRQVIGTYFDDEDQHILVIVTRCPKCGSLGRADIDPPRFDHDHWEIDE